MRSSFSATQNENLAGVPIVSMSVMPGYDSPTFIMIRRSARPIDTLTCETEPGPSAQQPRFMPISSAIGPDTRTIGACGPVDIAQVRRPIDGSRMHSIIAMSTGIERRVAAGHHRVGGDLGDGADAEAGREHPDDVVAVAARGGDHRVDLGRGRRHQRQAVAPAALDEGALHRVERVQQVVAGEAERRRELEPHLVVVGQVVDRRARPSVSPAMTAGIASATIRWISSAVLFEKHSGTMTGHASGTPKASTLKWASSSKIAAV